MKNFFAYLFGNGFSKLYLVFLLSILTSLMSQSEYGEAMYRFNYFQFFVILLGWGSQSLISIDFFSTGKNAKGRIIPNLNAFLLVNFFLFSFFVFLVFLFSSNYWPFFVLLAALFHQIVLFLLGIYHMEQDTFKFTLLFLGMNTLIFLGTIAFAYSNVFVNSRIYGELFGAFIAATFSILIFRRIGLLNFNFSGIRQLYVRLFPVLSHSLAVFLIFFVDRIFIANLMSYEDVGIYTAAFIYSQIGMLILDSKSRVWTAFVAEKYTILKKDFFFKFGFLYIFILILSFIILYLLSPAIFNIFLSTEYQSSLNLIPIILIALIFEALFREVHIHLFVNNQRSFIAYSSTIAAVAHLIFCPIFIQSLGLMGAALSFLVASLIKFLGISIFLSYFHKKNSRSLS